MKSQERHRLEQNVLAVWIIENLAKIKPYLTPILVAAIVVALVFGGWSLWSQQSTTSSGAAWDELFTAMSAGSVDKLEDLAETSPGTVVAHQALVLAADERLARGCEALFMDRASATQELNKAKKNYDTVLEQSRVSDLRERALYGLGRTYEALAGTRQSEGLGPAVEAYEKLLDNEEWSKGPFAELARQRVANLKSDEVKSFYDKFAAYERKSPFLGEPGTPGKRPAFDPDTLDVPPSGSILPKLKLKGEEPEKVAPAKSEPTKAEAAKTEPPKPAGAKPEAPKPEATKPEPPKPEAAKPEPKSEPAKTEPPKVEPPKVGPPKTEPPKSEPKAEPAKPESKPEATKPAPKS